VVARQGGGRGGRGGPLFGEPLTVPAPAAPPAPWRPLRLT